MIQTTNLSFERYIIIYRFIIILCINFFQQVIQTLQHHAAPICAVRIYYIFCFNLFIRIF